MTGRQKGVRTCDCPIDAVANMLGRKWVIILLRDLFIGKTRFNEFLAANPSLSNKVLSQKLREMEENGLVKKMVVAEPLEVHYHLTTQGKKLKSVMRAMVTYGRTYCNSPKNYKMLLDKFRS